MLCEFYMINSTYLRIESVGQKMYKTCKNVLNTEKSRSEKKYEVEFNF